MQIRPDNHRVNYRDGGSRKRESGNLCGSESPMHHIESESANGKEGYQERGNTNEQTGFEVEAKGRRFNLRTGQEGQEDRTQTRHEANPGGSLQAQKITAEDTQQNLYNRHRDAKADREQASKQSRSHPEGRDEPDIVHACSPFRERGNTPIFSALHGAHYVYVPQFFLYHGS